MELEKHPLSVTRLIWTDYPAFYSSLVPLVAWIIYVAWIPDWRGQGPVVKPEARDLFLTLIVLATAGGTSVLFSRILLFQRVFKSGALVKGKISQINFRRDHGRVEYAYIFDHKEYFCSVAVHPTAQTKQLADGEHVVLVVDRAKPWRAFIRDLYSHKPS